MPSIKALFSLVLALPVALAAKVNLDSTFIYELDNAPVSSPVITSKTGVKVNGSVYIVDMENTSAAQMCVHHIAMSLTPDLPADQQCQVQGRWQDRRMLFLRRDLGAAQVSASGLSSMFRVLRNDSQILARSRS
jgi:hypothetical protein